MKSEKKLTKEHIKEAVNFIFDQLPEIKPEERKIHFYRGCDTYGLYSYEKHCGNKECQKCNDFITSMNDIFKEEIQKQINSLNNITEELYITGRGKVLVCESCTYKKGDIFEYNKELYEIRGIELQGNESAPYKKAGLLVRKIKSQD